MLVFQGRNTIGLPAPVAQWTEHQPCKLVFTRQGALKTPRKCHFLKGEVAFSTQGTAYVQLQEFDKVPLIGHVPNYLSSIQGKIRYQMMNYTRI